MTKQKTDYTATESQYREELTRIMTVEDEITELQQSKRDMIKGAAVRGCNPKILRQMLRLVKMKKDERDALNDAMEIA